MRVGSDGRCTLVPARVARSRAAHAAVAAEPLAPPLCDPHAYREALSDVAERAEDLGLVDDATRRVLDAFEAEMVRVFSVIADAEFERLAAEVGESVAESVFGRKNYANRLDRQLAVGAAAVGFCAVEERVALVGDLVLRELLLDDVEGWPPRMRRLLAAVPADDGAGG